MRDRIKDNGNGTLTIRLPDNARGTEVEVVVPARMEVCPRCEGYGTHLNPNIGEHAYSQEEFDEAFEPGSEEREHYFKRGGIYDVTCRECRGQRVIAVPDETRINKRLMKFIEKVLESDARDEAEQAYERKMGY
jgi:hypothetical protein